MSSKKATTKKSTRKSSDRGLAQTDAKKAPRKASRARAKKGSPIGRTLKTPLHERIQVALANCDPVFTGTTRLRFVINREKLVKALVKAGLLPDFCLLEHVMTNLAQGTVVFLVSSENQVVTYSVSLRDVARALNHAFPKLAKNTRSLFLIASDGQRGVKPMTGAALVYERVPDFPHKESGSTDEIPF